jgi:hypothetical protein
VVGRLLPKPEPKLEDKQHIDAEERDDVAA